MTGARLVGSLLNVLEAHGGHVGLAATSNPGGEGIAVIIKRIV